MPHEFKRDCDRVGAALVALALLAGTGTAAAQRTEPPPRALGNAGIVEHPGAQVPLDLEFTAEDGSQVRLGQLVRGDRPVILNLVYYECPMLCGLVLQGMLDGMKALRLSAGRDFDVVTVSINPKETSTLARLKKQGYLKAYGRPEAARGWHFLVGTEPNIRRLADTVGFEYHWDPRANQFVHAAGIFVLTPKGKVARYLYGVQYEPRTLRLALTEAGQGTVGGTTDRIILYCFHYDSNQGRYVLAATNLMRMGGALSLVVVGVWLGGWWWRSSRRGAAGDGRGHP